MPIITIFTATGTQGEMYAHREDQLVVNNLLSGSSVLEAVLADGKYTPRAVTRNVDSAACKALIARGVEVVSGNLWDKESVKKALRGSEAVFGNVNYWDPEVRNSTDPQGKGEIVQGKNLVDAAKEEGVKVFIWSSVDSIPVYKTVIEEYLKESGVPYTLNSLEKTETGDYVIPIPKFGPEDTQSSTWVAHDLGQAAVALLNNYTNPNKAVLGKVYPVITMKFKYPEFAAAIATVFSNLKSLLLLTSRAMQFSFQTKIGLYRHTPFPNPDLVALGVKFGTMEEFIQAEVVPRFK
ncbi:hypothetical protein FB45DRAFT_864599 [Roridomyces roridus]|uniref:NmrA-like domain-containing protein n=1 Tax=Roridomyces roridus TaxID=1738132 RepID=A0AAD7FQ13_9AGAR|nr:hypothetical protein FB45DRAFT_864599 [Roridomyces roridus]